QMDFPPPVGMMARVSWPSRREFMIFSWFKRKLVWPKLSFKRVSSFCFVFIMWFYTLAHGGGKVNGIFWGDFSDLKWEGSRASPCLEKFKRNYNENEVRRW